MLIHRIYNSEGSIQPGWCISHELSGMKLVPKNYPSIRSAIIAFTKHAVGINWDRPKDELVDDKEVMEALENLHYDRS